MDNQLRHDVGAGIETLPRAKSDEEGEIGAMANSGDRPRRSPDTDYEMEEGEVVPGYDSGSDSGDSRRYVLQPRGDDEAAGLPEIVKRRRLEDVIPESGHAPPSPTPSSGSDRTISECSGDANPAVVARVSSFPCRICQKEFSSQRAVNGHMKVHSPNGRQEKEKDCLVAGMRSSMENARTNLVGGNRVDESSSTHPNPNESMAIVVAADNHPSNQVAANPPAMPQVVTQQPAATAPAGEQGQHAAPPAGEKGSVVGFKCKECSRSFATHQGLGGHVAGHANKRREAAAAAAAAAGVQLGEGSGVVACGGGAGPEPEKKYVCKACGKEYKRGQELGGHMRMHYEGEALGGKKHSDKKTVTKKRKATRPPLLHPAPPGEEVPAPAAVALPEVSVKLSLAVLPQMEGPAQPAPSPAGEVGANTGPAPATTRRIKIFGVYLTAEVHAE